MSTRYVRARAGGSPALCCLQPGRAAHRHRRLRKYIWLWDARTFEPVARLGGQEAYIFWLAWRADSQLLVSGSGDHTVRIWDTQALKDRMHARRDRQAVVARVEPMVQELFNELSDAGRVADSVKADTSLSRRARQVALQAVLATATKARSSTPASSGPAPGLQRPRGG